MGCLAVYRESAVYSLIIGQFGVTGARNKPYHGVTGVSHDSCTQCCQDDVEKQATGIIVNRFVSVTS